MREIKFRAWDIKRNRMLDLTTEVGRLGQYFEVEEQKPGSYFFMQFTGLHDKNGKEIFEGDIVRATGEQTWEVKWIERTAKFQFVNKNNFAFDMDALSPHEIIGNVYEHSNLLKSTP